MAERSGAVLEARGGDAGACPFLRDTNEGRRNVLSLLSLPIGVINEDRIVETQDLHPLAVITGGSNGIGYELGRQFAEPGYDLLIAAEDPGHLADAAQGLKTAGAQRVETCAVDLAREDGVRRLLED